MEPVKLEYYVSLCIFTFVAGITPGPNNMMLMTSGLNHGIRKSIPHYLGICIGFPVMVAAIGFGMGAVFSKYPSIYLYLKISGITYLIYLAWKIANAGSQHAAQQTKEPFSFIQAAAFQWLNPKAWAIGIGALAAFTTKENFTISVLAVIFVYLMMGFICMGLWLKIGQSLKGILYTRTRVQFFNVTMAVLLVISVVPMALTGIDSVS